MTSFDLYVPTSGEGQTHLHAENTTGILCRAERRYATFTVAGIVPAGSATCAECNRIGQAMAIEHTARTTGQVLTPEF